MLVQSTQLLDVSSGTNLMNAQVNDPEDRSTYEMLLSAFSLSHPGGERLLVSTRTPDACSWCSVRVASFWTVK